MSVFVVEVCSRAPVCSRRSKASPRTSVSPRLIPACDINSRNRGSAPSITSRTTGLAEKNCALASLPESVRRTSSVPIWGGVNDNSANCPWRLASQITLSPNSGTNAGLRKGASIAALILVSAWRRACTNGCASVTGDAGLSLRGASRGVPEASGGSANACSTSGLVAVTSARDGSAKLSNGNACPLPAAIAAPLPFGIVSSWRVPVDLVARAGAVPIDFSSTSGRVSAAGGGGGGATNPCCASGAADGAGTGSGCS